MPRLTSKYSNSALLLFLLSGLDILHHLGRLPPAAKRLKGGAVTPPETGSSAMAASPARSCSRG